MSEKRAIIIIPAFNEETSIKRVIEGVRSTLPQSTILVVNDGSKDLTSQEARDYETVVLDLPFNLGIGGAMQAGYKYAHEKGYDIAIQVDADGQHNPKEIPKLLRALTDKGVDMVIGSRFLGDSEFRSSIMRRIGILLFSGVISAIAGQKITDPTSGFRAANRKAIRLFALNYPQDYPEPEAVVLLHQCGLRMGEVPVEMSKRYSGESSITRIRSVYYVVKVLLAIIVDCFKKPPFSKEEEEGC
jgi:glycosyltransferase involved in cell wall biosynthesis